MSDYVVAVSKTGRSASEENLPNSFIFHSDYNSFKIIKTGVATFTIAVSGDNQEFTTQHGLTFTPLVTAFARDDDDGVVYPPNCAGVTFYASSIELVTNLVSFTKVGADATNMIFVFNNTDTETHTISVRYFCLETI